MMAHEPRTISWRDVGILAPKLRGKKVTISRGMGPESGEIVTVHKVADIGLVLELEGSVRSVEVAAYECGEGPNPLPFVVGRDLVFRNRHMQLVVRNAPRPMTERERIRANLKKWRFTALWLADRFGCFMLLLAVPIGFGMIYGPIRRWLGLKD